MLLPSLSRSSRDSTKRIMPSGGVAREDSVNSSRGRRMFTLEDGDASDNDGETSAESSSKAQTLDVEVQSPVEDEKLLESSRTGMKRYHALVELLTTEVGYLLDLRALVSVSLNSMFFGAYTHLFVDIPRAAAFNNSSSVYPTSSIAIFALDIESRALASFPVFSVFVFACSSVIINWLSLTRWIFERPTRQASRWLQQGARDGQGEAESTPPVL